MVKLLDVPEPEAGFPFVDTHCHVADRAFKGLLPSPEKQLSDYRTAGGQFLIVCSIDMESARTCLAFARSSKDVYFSCGWAPQTVTYTPIDKYEKDFGEWNRFLEANLAIIVAFGEIGLDFHHAKTLEKRERQIEAFEKILSIVTSKKKPIVLHVRNAGPGDVDHSHPDHAYNKPEGALRVVLAKLDSYGVSPSTVLFHCYSGPASMNGELARRGFWFSVPSSAFGIERWNKVSRTLPLDRLVTETDSPFQHPRSMEPVNMPANARYAIAAIAHARNMAQGIVAKKTVDNARSFFKIN
nr:TatD family hydrolase [Candidatus Sigynarchaeum springense]